MGYTFSAALVKKTGTVPATRKAIREGLENLGYRKVGNAADASLVLPLHHDKKSAWMTIALEMPESLDGQMEFLRKLAEEMHTAILYFMNFDSDFLYIGATDGKAVQHVHVGFIDEEDEAMTDSDDLSVFDALLPDEAARAEFRRILAVDDEERVFSEEAAQEMAALFGYTPEALFVDEDAEPFAVLAFDPPGQESVPFLMPEDAPPAFTTARAVRGNGNPICMDIHPSGGRGRGIRVTVTAEEYDAEDWELLPLHLTNRHKQPGVQVEECYEADAQPRRVRFADGSKGWIAEFPDAPIFCGVNPDFPDQYSSRVTKAYEKSGFLLYLAFQGGNVQAPPPPVLRPSMELMQDREAFQAWLRDQFSPMLDNPEKTHIWVQPMENREGAIHHAVPRVKLERTPFWLKDNDE